MTFEIEQLDKAAHIAATGAVQELLAKRRKDGLECFILDLNTVRISGEGWSVDLGKVNVKNENNTSTFNAMLDQHLGKYPWYQSSTAKPVQLPIPNLPNGIPGFIGDYKVLGKFGANMAMDAVLLIQKADGRVFLQHIVRPDGTPAFVGGILDKPDAVMDKCIQEILEELYSDDLFERGSETFNICSTLSPEGQIKLKQNVVAALKHNEFKVLHANYDSAANIFDTAQPFNSKFANFKKAIEQICVNLPGEDKTSKLYREKKEARDDLWVRLKCRLYEFIFAEEYRMFSDHVKHNLHHIFADMNAADPRNTNHAWMETHVHMAVLKESDFAAAQKNWKVKPTGGSDAVAAKCTPIEDLFSEEKCILYSSHSEYLLRCLYEYVSQNPSELQTNQAFVKQLEKIVAKLNVYAANKLHLHGAGVSVLRQQGQGQNFTIPYSNNEAQLAQLGYLRDINPRALVDRATMNACNSLNDNLTPGRRAIIEDHLERYNLPVAATVHFNAVLTRQNYNIIIDNSSSMNDPFDQNTTRWVELQNRIKQNLKILAVLGTKVKVYTINPCGQTATAVELVLDYSKCVTAPEIDQALKVDFNKLQSMIFRHEPNGGTDILPILKKIYGENGERCNPSTTQFLSDGDVDGEKRPTTTVPHKAASNFLKNRNSKKFQDVPFIVIGCESSTTNAVGSTITWAANMLDCNVSVVKDYVQQEAEFKMFQGNALPYNKDGIWSLLNILGAQDGGLAIYLNVEQEYTREQIEAAFGAQTDFAIMFYKGSYRQAMELRNGLLSGSIAQALPVATQINPPTTYAYDAQSPYVGAVSASATNQPNSSNQQPTQTGFRFGNLFG